MSYRVIVFDWDGTLVNSEKHIVSSIAYAAQEMGLPKLSYDKMKSIIGLGMREALLALYPELDEGQIQSVRKYYSQHFFSEPTDHRHLFDGVIELLDELSASSYDLAVATGKSRHGLEKALDATGLRMYFDVTRCADETLSKPDPLMLKQISEVYDAAPSEMLMIGDTEYDLEMASRFGMDSVGVSYGVHEPEKLLMHSPVEIIDHISQLMRII